MNQKDVQLFAGHATPKNIILRELPTAALAATTTIFLYAGHATPNNIVLSDPTVVIETGGGELLLAGASIGLSTSVAALLLTHNLAGVSDGIATASSSLTISRNLAGVTNGIATASGLVLLTHNLVGTADGIATSVSVIQLTHNLAGEITGNALATGVVSLDRLLSGATNGMGAVSGSLVITLNLAGIANGIASAVAVLTIDAPPVVEPPLTGGGSSGFVTRRYKPRQLRQAVRVGIDVAAARVTANGGRTSVLAIRSVDLRTATVRPRSSDLHVEVKPRQGSPESVEVVTARVTAHGYLVTVATNRKNSIVAPSVTAAAGSPVIQISRRVTRIESKALQVVAGTADVLVQRSVKPGLGSGSVRTRDVAVATRRDAAINRASVYAETKAVPVGVSRYLAVYPVAATVMGLTVYMAESGRIEPMISRRRDLQRRLNVRDRGFPSRNDMTAIARLIGKTGAILSEFINPDGDV